jgi:hypothetical protein
MTTWKKDYIADYPCIDKKDVKLCYHNNYWDGPISGVLTYGGERYYFDQCDENENYDRTGDRWSRRYLIYELTKEQFEEEDYYHNLFRTCVGIHTEYNDDGKRQIGAVNDREQWDVYYEEEAKRIPLDYKKNKIVGWFFR